MPRILVIDDDDAIRSFWKRKLAGEGYEVAVAENGAVASRLIHEQRFDLVTNGSMVDWTSGVEEWLSASAMIERECPNNTAPLSPSIHKFDRSTRRLSTGDELIYSGLSAGFDGELSRTE